MEQFHVSPYNGQHADIIEETPSLLRPVAFTSTSPTYVEPEPASYVWIDVSTVGESGPNDADGYLRPEVRYVMVEPTNWFATSPGQVDPYARGDASRVRPAKRK